MKSVASSGSLDQQTELLEDERKLLNEKYQLRKQTKIFDEEPVLRPKMNHAGLADMDEPEMIYVNKKSPGQVLMLPMATQTENRSFIKYLLNLINESITQQLES